ncbi:G1 family glutamic endopeptidase [Clostridium sp. WILCCON 0269]|uniref:G1 family glutamic endopeptidase n=1 Tax=Candidatus Clostridium eludens TaxID=3381663 RepID=A0ABW8SRI2_9CLOT
MISKKVCMELSKIAIAIIIAASLGGVVYAKEGDIYNISTTPVTDEGSISNILLNNRTTLFDLILNMSSYGYEVGGKIYNASDANKQFAATPTATIETIYSDIEQNDTPTSYTPQSGATVSSVSATNGTIAVRLSGAPTTTPALSDFAVTQSISGATATTVTPTAISTNGDVVTLTVPVVATTSAAQSVVDSVSYQRGIAVSASSFTVNPATTPTISTIGNIIVTVNQNDSYSLPTTVRAIMSDGSTENVSVTWDNQVDTSQPGTFTFNGTVNGYSGDVVLILNVEASSITSISFPDDTEESSNWAGYIVTPTFNSGYTSISGSWTVPNISSTQQNAAAAQWIGLGGSNTTDLLQMGTTEQMENGQPTAEVFWEQLPDVAQDVTSVPIGSAIKVSIAESSSSIWNLTFTVNTPDGQTRTQTISTTLDSSYAQEIGTSAEWISEDPSDENDQLLPLANMGTVQYQSAMVNGQTLNASDNTVQPIAMVSSNGDIVVYPSELGTDGESFTTTSNDPTSIYENTLRRFPKRISRHKQSSLCKLIKSVN